MAYATGNAATVDALMNALISFSIANAGMTEVVRRTETISTLSWTVVCLQKGTSFWWMRFRDSACYGFPATSSAGATWATITGRPASESWLAPLIQPFTSYHFFSEGTTVHMAAEMSSGAYAHLNFGDITKYGSWTGGQYFAVTRTSFNISADASSVALFDHCWPFTGYQTDNNRVGTNATSGLGWSFIHLPYNGRDFATLGQTGYSSSGVAATYNRTFCFGYSQHLAEASSPIFHSPNAYNNRSLGLRLEIFLKDAIGGGSGLLQPIGYVPNLRFINIANLNPKDVINTDWMVFPCQFKNGALLNSYSNSQNFGWAVRQ
jgi:hypothetical protein